MYEAATESYFHGFIGLVLKEMTFLLLHHYPATYEYTLVLQQIRDGLDGKEL